MLCRETGSDFLTALTSFVNLVLVGKTTFCLNIIIIIIIKTVHCAENSVHFDLVKSKRSLQISNVYPSVLLSLTLICDVIWQGLTRPIRKWVLLPFVCICEH